jgi:DNA polymerase-3 subunit chi
MIKEVHFHLQQEPSIVTCYLAICRIIESLFQFDRSIYVYSRDESMSLELNTLLWTFKDTAFCPHQLWQEQELQAPIVIGTHYPPNNFSHTHLVNLTTNQPAITNDLILLIEIIPNSEEEKSLARKRYQAYRQRHSAAIKIFP